MIKNYIKLAWRNLQKNPVYGLINILGLAIGIASCMLILMFVLNELSYDQWNEKVDRIVRPTSDINFGGTAIHYALTSATVGQDMLDDMPEVENYTRFRNYGSFIVSRAESRDINFRENDILYADSAVFEIFPFKVIQGDPGSCLTQVRTLAMSRTTAVKYFGSTELAVGQTLVLQSDAPAFQQGMPWKVTAVYEDVPENTHFEADFLLAMNGNPELDNVSPLWAVSVNFHTYVLLKEGVSFEQFEEKFGLYSRQKLEETGQQLLGVSLEEFEATGQFVRMSLQRLGDIHLTSDLAVELAANGSIQYVWIFSAIAFFILIIACINFMNLTTARSSHRAKEIGVRKALGGVRSSLMGQFLTETLMITSIGVLIALALVGTSLGWFNELTGKSLQVPMDNPLFWIYLICGTALVGLLAGSYPAFFLSAFDAIRVLKTNQIGRSKHGNVRSGLVIFQFSTAIVLVVGTSLMYNQLSYIQNKKLGFNKDQVVILEDAFALGSNLNSFKERMLSDPAVTNATVSAYLPVPSSRNSTTYTSVREFREDKAVSMGSWSVDHDYLATLGMEMKAGRFFDRAHPTDSLAIVLNETAAKNFGFDEPIGKKVYTVRDLVADKPGPDDFIEFTVIGVVEDFHWESMRENIGALGLYLGHAPELISFKYEADQSSRVISSLERNWSEMAPNQPFSFRFLDDSFARIYEAEKRVGKIAFIFAGLAIFISCLGLFGLASYMAEQRTKEIGIRKVLGANPGNIITLLSKDFVKLIVIALIIAAPVAIWGMKYWLQNFAYRIEIGWQVFLTAALAAALIVLFSVSYQSLRAAMTNPIDALRNE